MTLLGILAADFTTHTVEAAASDTVGVNTSVLITCDEPGGRLSVTIEGFGFTDTNTTSRGASCGEVFDCESAAAIRAMAGALSWAR